jgi:hypothetical protein
MPDYQFLTDLGPAPKQGTSLADLIGTARGVQAYQQAEQMNPLAQQKARMEIEQAQKINPLEYQQKEEAVKQAKTGTEKAQFGFESEKAQKSRDLIGALSTSEAFRSGNRQQMLKELSDTQQELIRAGYKPHEALLAVSPILDKAMRDPQGVVPFLENAVRQSVSPESKLGLQTGQVTTNAAGQLVNVKPALNRLNVLGETQGAQGQQNVAPMPVNPSQAQVGLANKATEVAGADYAQTIQDSTGAQGRIATFQKIKSLAPEAFTGVGGERKKLVAGIAQAVGIPAYELETSTTDELAKNTKLLALTGGNTDAARGIAELASPNAKMTKEAINRVADQLIGIENLKLAKSQFLSPYINNPAEYQRKLNQFNNVADFRIFQEATPEEVKKMKDSMSPAARAVMSNKIKEARALGIIQ